MNITQSLTAVIITICQNSLWLPDPGCSACANPVCYFFHDVSHSFFRAAAMRSF